jgi:hypothetical protein
MRIPNYLDTLNRYGLERLKSGDLQVRNDNIAVTADGDLQFGDRTVNALFRLVERWRVHQPTLNDLFEAMQFHSRQRDETLDARNSGRGPSFVTDIDAFHEVNDRLRVDESGASIYAGTICLVLNNLLQRFRVDAQPTSDAWRKAAPTFTGESFSEIIAAAANNFRHHDEWARTNPPTPQQIPSISVLQNVLGTRTSGDQGRGIRTNVCREIVLLVSDGAIEQLHERLFAYAKNVCDYSPMATCVRDGHT